MARKDREDTPKKTCSDTAEGVLESASQPEPDEKATSVPTSRGWGGIHLTPVTAKGFRRLCLMLAVAAFGLRLAGLPDRALTTDEVWTYEIARSSYYSWLWVLKDGRPPFSFQLIHSTLKLWDNLVMLLVPAALFGAATVGLLGWTGRVALGRRVGLIAGLWLLFSPSHIDHSQYARYYSFMIFFAVWAYLYLDLWVRMRRWRYLVFWLVPSALNLTNHFFASFVVGIQAGFIFLVLFGRIFTSVWKEKNVLVVSLFVVSILVLIAGAWIGYSTTGLNTFIQDQTTDRQKWKTSGIGISWAFWRPFLDSMSGWPRGGLPIALALFAVGAARAWRRNKIFLFHTVAILVVPIFVVYYVQPKHWFTPRYVSFAQPFYLATLAAGIVTLWELAIWRLPRRRVLRRSIPIVVAIAALAAPLLAFRTHVQKPFRREFRDVMGVLGRVIRPGDRVFVTLRNDLKRFHHLAPREIADRVEHLPTWTQLSKHHYLRRIAHPFWLVTADLHLHSRTEMDWALNTLSGQAFEEGFIFFGVKHHEINLSDQAMRQGLSELPKDLSSQVSVGREALRFPVFIPRSAYYYIMVSRNDGQCLVRFEDMRPLRWIRPATEPNAERHKIWLGEGRHNLTLLAKKGAVGNLEEFRLIIIPICGSSYRINAGSFDITRGYGTFDRPATTYGRFGIRLRMWTRLHYPVFVEKSGGYEFAVTADNDRPTTNQILLIVDESDVKRFYFNKCDNTLETQRTVIRLGRGIRNIGLRNILDTRPGKTPSGTVNDEVKMTFISELALTALDKPPANRP